MIRLLRVASRALRNPNGYKDMLKSDSNLPVEEALSPMCTASGSLRVQVCEQSCHRTLQKHLWLSVQLDCGASVDVVTALLPVSCIAEIVRRVPQPRRRSVPTSTCKSVLGRTA
jgi:hypothetical protein